MREADFFISVIILNYNQEKFTSECISSLRKSAYKNYEVVLVDNGSDDKSWRHLKNQFPDIVLLRNDENLGFCRGVNIGLRYAMDNRNPDCLLMLNNDSIADKNLLFGVSYIFLHNPDIGIVGGVEYIYDKPDTIYQAGHRFIWWLGVQSRIRRIPEGSLVVPVQSVPGSCLAIRGIVLKKVGFLDERFFSYYEDADLCMRVRRIGYKVVYSHSVRIRHRGSQIVKRKTSAEYYFYTRNQPLFMLKNCPRIFLINYFITYVLKVSLRMVGFFVIGKRRLSYAIFKGVSDFLKGRYGKGWEIA